LSGRIAWYLRSRPCLAEPPALSPSTMKSSHSALLAVGELAGKARHIERALASRQIARLARRFARRRGFNHLGDDLLRVGRMLFEPLLQLVGDDAFDDRPHLGRDQLVLGLR
jgi:hypothetical protein